jgi:hypothetical protein
MTTKWYSKTRVHFILPIYALASEVEGWNCTT